MWTLIIPVLYCFLPSESINAVSAAVDSLPQAPPKEMVNYMKRFGYLPEAPAGSPDSETHITKEGFKELVKQIQKYGGLPETGELDEETLKLMDTPRCGVPDVLREPESNVFTRRKRYALASRGWRKRKLTYFLSNWPSELDRDSVLRKLEKAFKIWSDASELSFSYSHSMDADLIIGFGKSYHGDSYPFDGRGNTLAHAFFPYQQEPYGGDIHFDDDELWTDQSRQDITSKKDDGVDLFTVATHEIGHSLGLAHSSTTSSIMFPYYKGFDRDLRIGYDDVLGLYDLYVRNAQFEDELEEKRNPTPHPRHTTVSSGYPNPTQPNHHTPERRRNPITTPNYNPRDKKPIPTQATTSATRRPRVIPSKAPRPPVMATKAPRLPVMTTKPHRPRFSHPPRPRFTTPNVIAPATTTSSARTDRPAIPRRPAIYPNRRNSAESGRNKTNALPAQIPDICHGHFDAIFTLRGTLFIFYKDYMWCLSDRGLVKPGYPVPVHSFFTALPKSVKKIDAIYERPIDNSIIIFSWRNYWTFSGNNLTRVSQSSLSDLGMETSHIDAAIVWGKNGHTYFFSGDQYWKYDERRQAVEKGYPILIKSRWKGLPTKIDGAFTWTDRQTYFFKEFRYWRFDNQAVSVDENFPRNAMRDWLACGIYVLESPKILKKFIKIRIFAL